MPTTDGQPVRWTRLSLVTALCVAPLGGPRLAPVTAAAQPAQQHDHLNLCSNSDFEQVKPDGAQFVVWYGAQAVEAGVGQNSARSLYVDAAHYPKGVSAGTNIRAEALRPGEMPRPGDTLTLSAWVKTHALAAKSIRLLVTNSNWTHSAGELYLPEGTHDWRRVSVTFEAPGMRDTGDFYRVRLQGTVPTDAKAWIDRVQLEAGDRTSAYASRENSLVLREIEDFLDAVREPLAAAPASGRELLALAEECQKLRALEDPEAGPGPGFAPPVQELQTAVQTYLCEGLSVTVVDPFTLAESEEPAIRAHVLKGEYDSQLLRLTNHLPAAVTLKAQLKTDQPETLQGVRQGGITWSQLVPIVARRTGQAHPDALIPFANLPVVTIVPGDSALLWLTINTDHFSPGTHTLSTHLTPVDGRLFGLRMDPLDFPLYITVSRVQLAPCPVKIGYFTHLPRQPAEAAPYLDNLASHYWSYPNSTLWGTRPVEQLRAGKLVTPDDFRDCQHLVQPYLEMQPVLINTGHLNGYLVKWKAESGKELTSDEAKTIVQAWVSSLRSFVVSLGYSEEHVHLWVHDEPASWKAETSAFLDILPTLKQHCGGMKIWMDAGGAALTSAEIMPRLEPYVDVWCPPRADFAREETAAVIERLRASGKPLEMYQCTTPMLDQSPLRYYRSFGADLWYRQVSAGHIYSYDVFRGDSFDNDDSPRDDHTDMALVYQGPRGPLNSRRWEAVREGIEDCIYLHMAEKALRKRGASADELAQLRTLAQAVVTAQDDRTAAEAIQTLRAQALAILEARP